MEITYFEAVLLHCLNRLKGERTIFSLFHLFHGKKSAQTIQDAHFYHLTPFFHSFPEIEREKLIETAIHLQSSGLLILTAADTWMVTKSGKMKADRILKAYPIPQYHDGLKYQHITRVFWERLSLLVQVCSNLLYEQKDYIPIQNRQETLQWVKSFLLHRKEKRRDISERLYRELLYCFERAPALNPTLFILRLTGHQRIGLTPIQAAEVTGMDYFRFQLEFTNLLHFLLKTIEEQGSSLPILSAVSNIGRAAAPFTLSAEKTFSLLNKGYQPDEIAAMRNLKLNTIEDHIVEIALNAPKFDISKYVQRKKEEKIIEAASNTTVRKLKEIRSFVPEASYFEIRLVLARSGQKWN
ncbi:YpbB family protein [Bacillus massilinigeriensis]|uniref:helix-turn-helix domain-containing protein n=1 Tax=Bacillus mediterraneensis TaxID=1805474 RepID=UPI0008F8648F|nr:helix-turn-helix domain-containing protein [Bacillus mediterraneensis]